MKNLEVRKKERAEFANYMIDNNLDQWTEKYNKDPPCLRTTQAETIFNNVSNTMPKCKLTKPKLQTQKM